MTDERDHRATPASEGGGDPLAACTAFLVRVPYEEARRLKEFLSANGIACRIRASDLTAGVPPSGSAGDTTSTGMIGRRRQLKAQIRADAASDSIAHDVLVRPEDLPARLASPLAATPTPGTGDPQAPADEAGDASARDGAAGGPVAVAELPWDAAWELVNRLSAAGIPAAVLDQETSARVPMERRIVPVGVRPEDVERARALIEP